MSAREPIQPGAVLLVTAMDEMESAAAALAEKLGMSVEIASTRAGALRLLERRNYAAVVLDQMLAEADGEGADLIWKRAGLAVPVQMSFALAGSARLEREVRSALTRRRREQQLASEAAAAAMDAELKDAVTGFLLESRLALAEANIPPGIEVRLQTLAARAEQLRDRLSAAAPAREPATAARA
ncbi:MAG: hypothetical protein WCA44_15355 [Acidobacteriaceae bacterium]|jgi:CheY-like chemotaxis protein